MFMMYDYCLLREVREWVYEKDFWNFARRSGKVVRYNYGSLDFFNYEKGIEMMCEEIVDGLYVW